jgi:DnaK suppressor protein
MERRTIRESLETRRRELLKRYRDELERADEELAQRDSEEQERAAEQWDVGILARLSDVDARHLAAIVAAMRRLDTGRYGVCTECGEAIHTRRLVALPEVTTCIGCAHAAVQKPL